MTEPMLEISENSDDTYHKVHVDTSAKALGAILLYKHAMEASFYPIAYFSRKLTMLSKLIPSQIGKCLQS